MLKGLYLYLLTLPVFFGIDILWIGVIARKFYFEKIGNLMADKINWVAAIVFYLLYIGGIIILSVLPGIKEESLKTTLVNAAIFGFLAYATYDLTNLTTLKNWSLSLSLVDMLWGTFLTTLVAFISFNLYKLIS